MEPLIATWGRTFTLIAPDSPGYGFSQPLQKAGQPVTSATIDDFAAATLEFADALGVGRFGIYGLHTGASIGVAMAHRFPARVAAVAANGFVVLTEDERTAMLRDYLPPLVPRWDGGHLAWLWGRLREQTIFFPWHDRRAATRMNFAVPPADQLQQNLDEFLAAGDQYHVAYTAAFTDRAERRLPTLNVPLLITATARDPLAGHLGRIGARSATVQIVPSADASAAIGRAFAHLASHPGDAGPVNALGERADSDALSFGGSEYLGAPGRQIRVVRTAARAEGPERTVILLHAPGSSAAALESLASRLADHADVLAVDLPGHGASDPPAATEGGNALAGTVMQLSAGLAPSLARSLATAGTTLVAIGSSAPVAIELAADLGRHTRVVLLEPPAWSAADTEEWLRHGLPAITPVWSGGHLLEAWHLVRDSRLFSPWFRRGPAGIRPGEPDLDDAHIHRDVRDLLRANGAWQALLRDALGYRDDRAATRGLGIIRLDQAPQNWVDVLAPGPAGNRPAS
jgi:pimeloyl-ACP methyl ester carboxylesterase